MFVSKVVRPRDTHKLLGSLLIACVGPAFVGVVVCGVAAMVAVSSSFAFGSLHFLPTPQFHAADRMTARLVDQRDGAGKVPRMLAATSQSMGGNAAGRGKTARIAAHAEGVDAVGRAARFDDVIGQAGLTT